MNDAKTNEGDIPAHDSFGNSEHKLNEKHLTHNGGDAAGHHITDGDKTAVIHICGELVGLNTEVPAIIDGITILNKIGGLVGGDISPIPFGHGITIANAEGKYSANAAKCLVTLILDVLIHDPAPEAILIGMNIGAITDDITGGSSIPADGLAYTHIDVDRKNEHMGVR